MKQLYYTSGAHWLNSSRTYDKYGNPYQYTDPRGNITSFVYSPKYLSAYLTSETQTLFPGNLPLTSFYSYNFTMGTRLSTLDPNGSNTTYKYDILGRALKINYPTGDYAIYNYNDAAGYVDITNENGWHTRQIYDGLSRLATTERFLNGIPYSNHTSTYNWDNRVSTNADGMGNMTSFQYDPVGRLTATIKPDGTSVRESYNDTGSWVLSIDEYNNYKCSIYDRLGRLATVIEYSDQRCHPVSLAGYGYVTNYYYDETGNLVRMTSASGRSTIYNYDSLDRPVSVTYADKSSESYSYDNNGNLVRKVYRSGATTSYLYDSLNRAINVTYYAPTGVRMERDNYTYDNDGRLNKLVTLNATLLLGFDSRGRMLNEIYYVNPVAGVVGGGGGGGGGCSPTNAKTANIQPNIHPCIPTSSPSTPSGVQSSSYGVSYSYMGENLVNVGLTLPNINSTGYTYDGLGRVLSVASGISPLATFNYNRNDQLIQVAYGNAVQTTFAYDKIGRTNQITAVKGQSTILSLSYTYNATGTVASVTGAVNGTQVSEQYRYDPLQRVTNATVTSSGATQRLWYMYDTVGNRIWQGLNTTSQTLPSYKWITTKYSYNPANNELLNYTTLGNAVSYSYDTNGNLISRNANSSHWTYKWDVPGHLISVSNNTGPQAYYAYDALGRRLEAKEGVSATFYAYLGTETQSEIIPAGSTTSYAFANGMRIAKYSTYTIAYYHPDALGSTRSVTDSIGKVVFTDNYQPFGQNNGAPTGSETYRFTGKPVSQTTGLYYEYQRWYDPTIGRFISADHSPGHRANPQSLNLYVYVLNDPSTNTDPTGLDCFSSLSSFGGCAGGFLYDNTVGAAVNSYNWYQGASDRDRWAFWAGVGTAVGIGVLVGASCVVAACAGLALVGMGLLAGATGSLGAADAYHFSGGQSEGGLRASMFWGGIGAGLGFAGGSAGMTSIWNGGLERPPLSSEMNLGSEAARFRIGTSEAGWYSDAPFRNVGALEDEFGSLSRSFTQNVYRYTVQFAPDARGFLGPQGVSGASQFLVESGSINVLSTSLYSLAPAYVSPMVAIAGVFTAATVPD
jgi:RHS repeat-associated protein